MLKPPARSAEPDGVYGQTTIASPSARAQSLAHDVTALVRERRSQDPGLSIPDALVALELVKTSLLEDSGIALVGRRIAVVAAAALSLVVAGVAVFLLSR